MTCRLALPVLLALVAGCSGGGDTDDASIEGRVFSYHRSGQSKTLYLEADGAGTLRIARTEDVSCDNGDYHPEWPVYCRTLAYALTDPPTDGWGVDRYTDWTAPAGAQELALDEPDYLLYDGWTVDDRPTGYVVAPGEEILTVFELLLWDSDPSGEEEGESDTPSDEEWSEVAAPDWSQWSCQPETFDVDSSNYTEAWDYPEGCYE